jgi:hypothetical protein
MNGDSNRIEAMFAGFRPRRHPLVCRALRVHRGTLAQARFIHSGLAQVLRRRCRRSRGDDWAHSHQRI